MSKESSMKINQEVMEVNQDAEPVIEDHTLPAMGGTAGPDLMGESAAAEQLNLMSEPSPSGEEEVEGYPDMMPKEDKVEGELDAASFAAGEHGEGYLRLVVSVDGGKMSVIDASVVSGPFVEQPDLTGAMAYQVLVAERRIAGEAFSDLSVESGFAPPDDPSIGHHLAEIAQFDFVVRIPRSEVTLDQLENLEIELVRPTHTTEFSEKAVPAPGVSFAEAAARAGVEDPKVVARMVGLKLDKLPEKAKQNVLKGLR